MSTAEIITSVISTVALIISIANVIYVKKQISVDAITKCRVDWIKDVRLLLQDFLTEYNGNRDVNKLRIIRNKICLYLRSGVSSYKNLKNALDLCIQTADPSISTYNPIDGVIEAAQTTLSNVWIRAKREAGITKRIDDKFAIEFESKK